MADNKNMVSFEQPSWKVVFVAATSCAESLECLTSATNFSQCYDAVMLLLLLRLWD